MYLEIFIWPFSWLLARIAIIADLLNMLEKYIEEIKAYLETNEKVTEIKKGVNQYQELLSRNAAFLWIAFRDFVKPNNIAYFNDFVIGRCDGGNTVHFYGYDFTHLDRKFLVLTLTGITFIPLAAKRGVSGFRFRNLVPYFLFYSLLFCRETLNPYYVKERLVSSNEGDKI